ncbi:MAG: hypothetical protein K0U52_00860, partial [Gammaproteobacteria bacterium]|nr:hypothetical protein [Gammaproteobacteria bacterium]
DEYLALVTPGGQELCKIIKQYLPNVCGLQEGTILGVLGQGVFGIVLLMRYRKKHYAVKVIVEKAKSAGNTIEKEIAIQNDFYKLGLAPKVTCHQVVTNRYGQRVHVVSMDRVDGNLFYLLCLIGHNPRLVKEAARQLIEIMTVMRHYGITHGDMHGGNVGFRHLGEGRFQLMLLDFGQSSTKVYNPIVDAEQFLSALLVNEHSPHAEVFAEALQGFLNETPAANGYQLQGTRERFLAVWRKYAKYFGRRRGELAPVASDVSAEVIDLGNVVSEPVVRDMEPTMVDSFDDDGVEETKSDSLDEETNMDSAETVLEATSQDLPDTPRATYSRLPSFDSQATESNIADEGLPDTPGASLVSDDSEDEPKSLPSDNEIRRMIREILAKTQRLDSMRESEVRYILQYYFNVDFSVRHIRRLLKEELVKDKPLKICKTGYERNPVTGRCRKVCKEDQVRSPKSGRCIKSPAARQQRQRVKKICPAGYEKNPATGRCRKVCTEDQVRSPKSGRCIKSPAARQQRQRVKKRCPVGFEKNPATGRCRKVCKEDQVRSPKSGRCLKKCKSNQRRNSQGRCVRK